MRFLLLAAAFVAAPATLRAQSADEKLQTIKFLAALQQPDGGFIAAATDGEPKSTLRATSAAIRAITYLGGDVPNPTQVLRFVKTCANPATGAFADTPKGKEDVSSTAIGMMAVAVLAKNARLDDSISYLAANAKTFEERRLAVAGMEAARKFAPALNEWFAEIAKDRNTDGTYGKDAGQTRETGGIAAMILRSGGKLPDDQRRAIVAALLAGQRADGGFGKGDAKGSDLETTYRVMRAFHLLGEKPKDVARLKEFLASHRNKDGGYGVAPGQPSTVGGTYFAAVIGHWLER